MLGQRVVGVSMSCDTGVYCDSKEVELEAFEG